MEKREQRMLEEHGLLLTHMSALRGYSRVLVMCDAKEKGGVEMSRVVKETPPEPSNHEPHQA